MPETTEREDISVIRRAKVRDLSAVLFHSLTPTADPGARGPRAVTWQS
jgi:hypothetical protein